MIEKLQDQLLLAIGVGSLAFLVTAFNLKGCSLKGSAGKAKKKRGRKIHEGA